MINRIDFDILKMDKRLVQGKNGFDENSRQILKTVVKMCKNLNKMALCEGVDTKGEVDYLRETAATSSRDTTIPSLRRRMIS